MGSLVFGSPLALAIAAKGAAGMFLGRRGWREDLDEGVALARSVGGQTTRSYVQLYRYAAATQNGAVLPDAQDVTQAAETLEIAQWSGNNTAVAYALLNRAVTLIHTDSVERTAAFDFLARAREMFVDEQLIVTLRRMADLEFARERARSADLGGAIELATTVLAEQFDTGEMVFRGPATAVLVEALLSRGSAADIEDAQRAIDRLAAVPTEQGFVLHELPLLRLRALLARARGDEPSYRQFVARFRARAAETDFEGYLAQAEAMASA
jgi:adenylate cyclase